MNALIIDNDQQAIDIIVQVVASVDPSSCCTRVSCAAEACECAQSNTPDVVFLSLELPETDGFDLAKQLKKQCGHSNIVFLTRHVEHALKAHEQFVSGFLMKPLSENDIRTTLENLRQPLNSPHKPKLYAQCFGNFEVFTQDGLLHFKRSKTKELLAYLIDRRGARCTTGELISVLWEDNSAAPTKSNQLRNLIHDLRQVLAAAGLEAVLIRERGSLAIDRREIICDYYDFLLGEPAAGNIFQGEYMMQYSWAEKTVASLAASRPQQN
ncbi:MAG: response regulator [Raoultibacter sp.]